MTYNEKKLPKIPPVKKQTRRSDREKAIIEKFKLRLSNAQDELEQYLHITGYSRLADSFTLVFETAVFDSETDTDARQKYALLEFYTLIKLLRKAADYESKSKSKPN